MTSTPSRPLFYQSVHDDNINSLHVAHHSTTQANSFSGFNPPWQPPPYNAQKHSQNDYFLSSDSIHFEDFVARALQPLSILVDMNQAFQSYHSFTRLCIPLLDDQQNVLYFWVEEDYNSLIREGLLREAKQVIAQSQMQRRFSGSVRYMDPPPQALLPPTAEPPSLNINTSMESAQSAFLNRRGSLPSPVIDFNPSLYSRRHSIGFAPDRVHQLQQAMQTQTPMSVSPIHNSFSVPVDLSNVTKGDPPNPRKKSRLAEVESEEEEERVLVFDGLVRRRNGNNQPQDEFQIKFKLI